MRIPGLNYDTVRRPAGPTDAELKLDELTRQLEMEMQLSSPKAVPMTPVLPKTSVNSLRVGNLGISVTSPGIQSPGRSPVPQSDGFGMTL